MKMCEVRADKNVHVLCAEKCACDRWVYVQDKSDVLAEMRGNLLGNFISSQRRDKATFYSPSEEWILPAASTMNPEGKEFVVDSGASMHMASKTDLDEA